MKFEYDKEVDAAYITLRKGEVDHTKQLDRHTIVDFDKNGNIIGIELLFVKERNPNFLKEFKSEITIVS